MASPHIFIYTNIPSPYKHHFWEAVDTAFPGSAVIFTEPMHRDRVWVDEAARHSYRHHYFMQDFALPRVGRISPGLIPWLGANARGAFHLLGACGRGNKYLIRYMAKALGGSLVQCNDGAFADSLTERAVRNYRRRFLNSVPAAFTAGRIGKEYFKKLGYRDEQIFNSYFSHDVDYFTHQRIDHGGRYREQIREKLEIPQDHFVLLAVSRLMELKRLEDLYEALLSLERKLVEKIHLVLIGDGDHVAPVNAMQKDLNRIRFHWIKSVLYDDMPKYYAMSDVLAFPSEGDIWGLVVNESLSMGKPVICTERVGASEMIRDGENGFLVPVRAPAEIADRIDRLYNDRLLLARMSKKALDISERWNSRLAVDSLKQLVNYVQMRRR